MIQVIVLGFIAIFTLLFLSKADKISKKNLAVLVGVSIALSTLFIYIEFENEAHRENIKSLTLDFEQDKNISCGEYTINRNEFNMASNSFIAKKDSKHKGLIIPFETCIKN
jgi:ACR3 family arsenite efflux pump ArsB